MKDFTKIAAEYDKGRKGENIQFWAEEAQRLTKVDEHSCILDLGC